MKSNKLYILLVLFLSFSLLALFHNPTYSSENKQANSAKIVKGSEEDVTDSNADEGKNHKVMVYYFHGNRRCMTCILIETLTMEAVNGAFENELRKGTVQSKIVNVDEEENKHFIKDYNLFTKSVIVSDIAGTQEKRWKNLEKVWEYVLDEEKFKEYIINEIKEYL